jgi:hypothetical protein
VQRGHLRLGGLKPLLHGPESFEQGMKVSDRSLRTATAIQQFNQRADGNACGQRQAVNIHQFRHASGLLAQLSQ